MATQKSTDLPVRVARFIKKHGMKPSRFGKLAVGDPCFVLELLRGRSPTLRTVERIEKFMKGYKA